MSSLPLAARFAGAKAVLWDVDGTLADSTTLGFTSTNAVLLEAGLPAIDLAQYKRGTRFPTPERMAWHATGAPSDPVGARLGARFDEHYVRLVDTRTAGFYPGIADLLRALHDRKGGAQAVLSNACGAYARRVVDVNGARAFFKATLGADDDAIAAPKPSPEGLIAIAKANGWEPETCVYVGDSPSDGAAARAAGMMALGCAWGAHEGDELRRGGEFDRVVATVAELRQTLLDDTCDDDV